MPHEPTREFIGSGPRACCFGMTANCLACSAGMTEERYCAINPDTSGCKTEVELSCCRAYTAQCMACVAGITIEEYCHFKPHSFGCKSAPKPRGCCRAYTAQCMACVAGITKEEYCHFKPHSIGCNTEVELSALDTLEAPLARRIAGPLEDPCAENPNTSRCIKQKERYCARIRSQLVFDKTLASYCAGMTEERYCAENPHSFGCRTEVELSAVDTLESPLASIFLRKEKKRCCSDDKAHCYACKAGLSLKVYCDTMKPFALVFKGGQLEGCKNRCCNDDKAHCLACKSDVTVKYYCDAMKNIDAACWMFGRCSKVELSALDTLEAPLVKRNTLVAIGCSSAECWMFGRCSEVELSALDTLESPLARRRNRGL